MRNHNYAGELGPAPSAPLDAATTDTVNRLIEAIRRRKLLAGGIFLVAMALAAAFIAVMPKEYSAEMRLFMTRSRVDAPVSAGERPAEATASSDLSEADINSELELLKSNDLLEKAARSSGLLAESTNPTATALVLKDIQKNLEVTVVKKTNIISVKYQGHNAAQAQTFVNTVGDLYLERHTTIHHNRESSEFFAGKSNEYKAQLDEAQKELSGFEQQSGVGLLDAQREQNLRRHAELQANLAETGSQLRQAEDQANILRTQLKSLPATVNSQNRSARNESLIEKLKVMVVELEAKHTELLSKFDPKYRLVLEVEEQLRNTKAALDRELAPGIVDSVNALNPLRQSVESELMKTETTVAGLRAKQKSIATELQHELGAEAGLARSTPRYEDLKRRAKIAEENYLLYRRKQEDSRIAEEMDQQRILNVSVLQSASFPTLPVERHRAFLLMLFVFAGALLSIATALIVDQMDKPLETALEAASAAGVPVIANFSRGVQKCS